MAHWLAALRVLRERDDERAGVVAATVANVHRDPKRKPEPWWPSDFFPGLKRPKAARRRREMTSAELKDAMAVMALGMGWKAGRRG